MKRTATLALVLWSLVAMPAFCAGGLLEHACECGSESNCNHEANCGDDPCSAAVVRHRPHDHDGDDVSANGFGLPATDEACNVDLAAQPLRPERWQPPPLVRLPVHQSDIPLLV